MKTFHAPRSGRSRTLAPALIALALLSAPLLAPAARAQGKDGEIWVGYYSPDPEGMDSDISFGLRGLQHAPNGLGFGFEVGYISSSGEVTSGAQTGNLDWDSIFIDGVFELPIGHGKKVIPAFVFGTGIAFSSADASLDGRVGSVSVDDLDTTGLTLQAGFGVKFLLGKVFYLRPAARVRWFEARGNDDIDQEYLIGFGRAW